MVSRNTQPPLPPDATGHRRNDVIAMTTAAAIAFGTEFQRDPALRARCESRIVFLREYSAWKAHEYADSRAWRCCASNVLNRYSRFNAAACAQHNIPRIRRVVGAVVYFANRGGMAAAAKRVNERRARVEADKQGIQVTPALVWDETVVLARGYSSQHVVTVTNQSDRDHRLFSAKLVQRVVAFTVQSPVPDDGVPLLLAPGSSIQVLVSCHPVQLGMSRDIISLHFGDFTIGRYLQVRCGDPDALGELAPTAPFQKRRRQHAPPPPAAGVESVPAPKAKRSGPAKPRLMHPLGFFDIPQVRVRFRN